MWQVIVNLGGNVLCIGEKTDNSAFKIGIQKPFADRSETIAVMDIRDKSVVSSGIYERCFEQDGTLYHHLLNPKNRHPYDNGLIAVTIISDQSVDGDAEHDLLCSWSGGWHETGRVSGRCTSIFRNF